MNQRKVSARYYLFEDLLWETPGFAHLKVHQTIADLQLLAGLIWRAEGGKGACPVVRTRLKNDTSYYFDGTVHLVRKHQNIGGLVHEMAHALGTRDKLTHGPAFRARCFRLYQTYGGWSCKVDWDAKKSSTATA